jgi:tRNA(adenine34) deaminase
MDPLREATDKAIMMRCIELSRIAVGEGEYPFGAVIALNGQIVAEAINRTNWDGDVSRHAEVIALSMALKAVGRQGLARASLYTNIEPCAMCSYCIREAWVGRVVYSLHSPIMGGVSKWTILRDRDLSDQIPIFGPAPEIVSGILHREAQQVWQTWNPLTWEMMRLRGVFSAPDAQGNDIKVLPAHIRSPLQHLAFMVMRLSRNFRRRDEAKRLRSL